MKSTGKKKESKSKGKSQNEKSPGKEKDSSKVDPKGKAKKGNKDDPKKSGQKNEPEKKPVIKYNLDFIYRREKYTLKNLKDSFLISKIRDLISEKISVNAEDLKLYYKDKELKVIKKPKNENKELTEKQLNDKEIKEKELKEKELKEKDNELNEDDKDKEIKEEEKEINIYELIKNDNAPFLDVRKESSINQNIISLNTKVNLIYKVSCKPVSSYLDLVNKIEQFFRDICLEKHYLCEPTAKDAYDVCFSCSDHCFQFKRYMMNISRTDQQYKKTKFDIPKVDKSKIIEPKIDKNKEKEEIDENINKTEKIKSTYRDKNNKTTVVDIEFKRMKHKEDDYFQKEFINTGPYMKYEEIKKKQEIDDKKKWISKKKFSVV